MLVASEIETGGIPAPAITINARCPQNYYWLELLAKFPTQPFASICLGVNLVSTAGKPISSSLSVYNSFQILVGYKLINFYLQEPSNNERVARE